MFMTCTHSYIYTYIFIYLWRAWFMGRSMRLLTCCWGNKLCCHFDNDMGVLKVIIKESFQEKCSFLINFPTWIKSLNNYWRTNDDSNNIVMKLSYKIKIERSSRTQITNKWGHFQIRLLLASDIFIKYLKSTRLEWHEQDMEEEGWEYRKMETVWIRTLGTEMKYLPFVPNYSQWEQKKNSIVMSLNFLPP